MIQKYSRQYFLRTGGRRNGKEPSERFGKILQQRQSISINRQDTSTSINTQLDSLIPASKIANLSQGTFVGSVADNFGEEIEQKIFHARIIVDNEKVAAETRAYKKIPVINEFKDADGNDIMQQQIDRNYSRIKADVLQIIEDEMERIANDPDLKHLIPQEDGKKRGIGTPLFYFSLQSSSRALWIVQRPGPSVRGKIIPRCACGIFPESLAQSGTERRGRQEIKSRLYKAGGCLTQKTKRYEQKQLLHRWDGSKR